MPLVQFEKVVCDCICSTCGKPAKFETIGMWVEKEKLKPHQCPECWKNGTAEREEKQRQAGLAHEAKMKTQKIETLKSFGVGYINHKWGFPVTISKIDPACLNEYPEVVSWADKAAKGEISTSLGFFGKVGRGKTVLACLAAMRFASFVHAARIETDSEFSEGITGCVVSVHFDTVSDVTRTFRSGISSQTSEEEILREFARRKLQIIDDLGPENDTDYARSVVYSVIDHRDRNGLSTVWTSNLTPEEFQARYGERMASRLWSGTVIEVTGTDRRFDTPKP